jgi:hypothetical protein
MSLLRRGVGRRALACRGYDRGGVRGRSASAHCNASRLYAPSASNMQGEQGERLEAGPSLQARHAESERREGGRWQA